jgi:hypothetical protein
MEYINKPPPKAKMSVSPRPGDNRSPIKLGSKKAKPPMAIKT